jgi:hypothetical protein
MGGGGGGAGENRVGMAACFFEVIGCGSRSRGAMWSAAGTSFWEHPAHFDAASSAPLQVSKPAEVQEAEHVRPAVSDDTILR